MAEVKNPAPDQRTSLVKKDLVMVSTFLMFMMVIFGPFVALGLSGSTEANTGDGSSIRQIGYFIITGVVFIALKPWENYRRLLAIPLPLLIGLGYCWLSILWAIEPGIAFRRLVLATMVMWTLFAAMRQLKFEEILTLLRWALVILLVVNFLVVYLAPAYGIHDGNALDEYSLAGDWRGVMQHKNFAGATCAITLIAFAFDRGRMPRFIQWTVMAGALYFLYRSNSKTSFGLGLASLAAGWMFVRYNRRYRLAVIICIAVLAIAATVLEGLYQNPLLGKFSDPKAFTGRMSIWIAMYQYVVDHPWFGSGYGSFWNIGPRSPIFQYATGEVARMPNGHNGFLDLAAQLGIPGMILIVGVAVIWPLKTLLDSPIVSGTRGALIAAIFIFCIGHNATESSLFDRDMTIWVLFMVAIAMSQPNLINYKRAKFDVHDLFRFTKSSLPQVESSGSGERRRRRTSGV